MTDKNKAASIEEYQANQLERRMSKALYETRTNLRLLRIAGQREGRSSLARELREWLDAWAQGPMRYEIGDNDWHEGTRYENALASELIDEFLKKLEGER